MRRIVIEVHVILGLAWVSVCLGQNTRGIYTDQDFFSLQNEDRNYTMGFGFSLTGDSTQKDWMALPPILSGIDRFVSHFHRGYKRHEFIDPSIQIGFTGFTPRDIDKSEPIFNDRPYSSLFIFSAKHNYVSDAGVYLENSITTDLTLALIGVPALPRLIQGGIHVAMLKTNTGIRPWPNGWKHQIKFEPSGLFRYKRKLKLTELNHRDGLHAFQIMPSYSLEAGYYTNGAAGIHLRVGKFNNEYWAEDANLLGNGNMLTQNLVDKDHRGIYLYADARARYVVHNGLLTGMVRNSPVVLESEWVNRTVFEFNTGVVFELPRHRIMLEPFAFRTPEFTIPGVAPRNHYWGSIGWFWTPKTKEKK